MNENEEDFYEPRGRVTDVECKQKEINKMTGELSRAMGRGRSTIEQ